MSLSSEKLVNYLITQIETTQRQIEEAVHNKITATTEDEHSYFVSATDELRGYKFALEDILEVLPDFDTNN